MTTVKQKDLKAAAVELNEVFGLDPAIETKKVGIKNEDLEKQLKKAAKLMKSDDVLSEDTINVLTEIGAIKPAEEKKNEKSDVAEEKPAKDKKKGKKGKTEKPSETEEKETATKSKKGKKGKSEEKDASTAESDSKKGKKGKKGKGKTVDYQKPEKPLSSVPKEVQNEHKQEIVKLWNELYGGEDDKGIKVVVALMNHKKANKKWHIDLVYKTVASLAKAVGKPEKPEKKVKEKAEAETGKSKKEKTGKKEKKNKKGKK